MHFCGFVCFVSPAPAKQLWVCYGLRPQMSVTAPLDDTIVQACEGHLSRWGNVSSVKRRAEGLALILSRTSEVEKIRYFCSSFRRRPGWIPRSRRRGRIPGCWGTGARSRGPPSGTGPGLEGTEEGRGGEGGREGGERTGGREERPRGETSQNRGIGYWADVVAGSLVSLYLIRSISVFVVVNLSIQDEYKCQIIDEIQWFEEDPEPSTLKRLERSCYVSPCICIIQDSN